MLDHTSICLAIRVAEPPSDFNVFEELGISNADIYKEDFNSINLGDTETDCYLDEYSDFRRHFFELLNELNFELWTYEEMFCSLIEVIVHYN